MKELALLLSRTEDLYNNVMYMSYLTDEEEQELEENKEIHITRDNRTFFIDAKNIFGFGEMNFDEDSVDIDILDSQRWFSPNDSRGRIIPVFDYKRALIKKENGSLKTFETWCNSEIAKYAYCCLGKPKKAIIFKEHTRYFRKRL